MKKDMKYKLFVLLMMLFTGNALASEVVIRDSANGKHTTHQHYYGIPALTKFHFNYQGNTDTHIRRVAVLPERGSGRTVVAFNDKSNRQKYDYEVRFRTMPHFSDVYPQQISGHCDPDGSNYNERLKECTVPLNMPTGPFDPSDYVLVLQGFEFDFRGYDGPGDSIDRHLNRMAIIHGPRSDLVKVAFNDKGKRRFDYKVWYTFVPNYYVSAWSIFANTFEWRGPGWYHPPHRKIFHQFSNGGTPVLSGFDIGYYGRDNDHHVKELEVATSPWWGTSDEYGMTAYLSDKHYNKGYRFDVRAVPLSMIYH